MSLSTHPEFDVSESDEDAIPRSPTISNPVSRDCVLLRTNVNLLKRVPEHDSPTFCVLHRTKCKPMHSEWECSQTINVLHKTVREREKEREGGTERERERARERLQKGCAQIVQCTLVMFMPKPQMLYIYIYCLIIYIAYIYI